MIGVASLLAAVLFAAATYLLLSPSLLRVAFGFLLLTNAANLLVLTAGGLPTRAVPPLGGASPLRAADPLPQAFILTAIVIGLGLSAVLLAWTRRTARELDREARRGSRA